MKRLLRRDDLMGLPCRNSFSPGRLQYRVVDHRIDTSWKQNPFVTCEMLKLKSLIVSRHVRLGQNDTELSLRERNDRQLGVRDWSRNKRHMKFVREHTSH